MHILQVLLLIGRNVELDEPEEHNEDADDPVEVLKPLRLVDALLVAHEAHSDVNTGATEHEDTVEALQVTACLRLKEDLLQAVLELLLSADAASAGDAPATARLLVVFFALQTAQHHRAHRARILEHTLPLSCRHIALVVLLLN